MPSASPHREPGDPSPLLTEVWSAVADIDASAFGFSVDGAGDVNCDGFDDVIVGDPGVGDPVEYGRFYVYHGSADGLSLTPNHVRGTTVLYDDDYGYSVAGAGDVDGDGCDEVIVGAPERVTGFWRGFSGIYYGSSKGISSWRMSLKDTGAPRHGHSVAGAGDVDADGYDDVIIGAPFSGASYFDFWEGEAYLRYGGISGIDGTRVWVEHPRRLSQHMGQSVSAAGDVDGDGYADVIVGSGWAEWETDHRADLWMGPMSNGRLPDWSVVGDDLYGHSVSAAGDVNGDGFGDVIVGAPDEDGNGGWVYVYHGSTTGLAAVESWSVGEEQVGSSFGWWVSDVGDVNADGYDDVMVTAPGYDGDEVDEGKLYLYLGSATGLGTNAAWTWTTGAPSAGLGAASGAGDVNGDGLDDVVAGAADLEPVVGGPRGKAFVFHGGCFDAVDEDGDGAGAACDCDDADPTAYPGATEVCDGVDNTCSGTVPADELDLDGDGVLPCAGDCDDDDATAYPGAPEVCDGIDNACLGSVPADELDSDLDGVRPCGGDCDDQDERSFHGASELCDGVDNACAGSLDPSEQDVDRDGVMTCAGDCDDDSALVHPGAPELCDGVDNACAGAVPANEADADVDGVRICGGDCSDGDPTAYPGAPQLCDGIDNPCTGAVPADELDGDLDGVRVCAGDCADGDPTTWPGAPELCDRVVNTCTGALRADEIDGDGDGVTPCEGDCDDGDGLVYPGARELCDGKDNVCAGSTPADENDGDVDGVRVCAGDCDDSYAAIYPGAPELCDGRDNACDGTLDPDEADLDQDGLSACGGDCEDNNPFIRPGIPEQCNGVDDSCAGGIAEDEQDVDDDGVMGCAGDCDDGDPSVFPGAPDLCDGRDNRCTGTPSPQDADTDLDGVRVCAGDCDDGYAATYAGAPEVCDQRDNNCDGAVDEACVEPPIVDKPGGCSCSTSAPVGGMWLLALTPFVLRRRNLIPRQLALSSVHQVGSGAIRD